MLTQLEKAEQRWGGANKLIDQWLTHRRKLLIQYFTLAGLAPYTRAEKSLPSINDVQEFCAQLVDYVSEGHFEVYDRVVSECATHGPESKAIAQSLLPKISDSTDTALDFNDKYTESEDDKVLYQLDKDLAQLAQAMESRFEYEDELLEILHSRHS
ncbi:MULTISPECIES: sigma D regulator [Shewanella]|jgi:regulator of sigma D|uniref:Sigma D regulator n=1 Tax=Shewanella holmiensis TaxID=2952222 RepID=A0A9X2WMR1_9GAMM|nr:MULTISPECIES: sigma D regulator [Shewanella]MCT7942011.1 sigma D regulator [Shewanella holmiensis]MDP5147205.1 sigma D regulator [Shewanella sp. ULN5]